MTRLTIGMPVYNGEKFLPRALADLSAQGFADMRVLVSDNASTDFTPDILSDFAARDPRIIVHRQTENIGPVANYEWTLAAADTPFFAFAAHDDGWSPGFAEALFRSLEARPDAQLAAPRVRMMDVEGAWLEDYPYDAAIDGAEGIARTRLCLARANPSWFHGIYRREAFAQSWRNSRRYRHVWGFDPLVVLPFLLSGAVTGSNEAEFHRRVTGLSDEKYRPHTAAAQARVSLDFSRYAFGLLKDAQMGAGEKAALLPVLLRYCRHAGKPGRILKLALKSIPSPSGRGLG